MYNRRLETDAEAKALHNAAHKKIAEVRLRAVGQKRARIRREKGKK